MIPERKEVTPAFDFLAPLIADRAGLRFLETRKVDVERRIRSAMHRARIRDLSLYAERLKADAQEFDALVAELTVGETYFFRDTKQFEMVRDRFLPDLASRESPRRPVRAWSAGCSTGEEAYSLAILFLQAKVPNAHVLATDISRPALAKAREGTYGAWSFRNQAVSSRSGYFIENRRHHFTVGGDVKRLVTFSYLNLAQDTYPSFANGTWGLDLILCRNVLIYFTRETIQRVARQLLQCLAPGGWLLLGSSDPLLETSGPFECLTCETGVFYRRKIASDEKPSARSFREDREARPELPAKSSSPSETKTPARETSRGAKAGDDSAGDETAPEEVLRAIRALAKRDSAMAEQACADALKQYPFVRELHFLHGVLCLELSRETEAASSLRRAIFLDRSLAVAHFALGTCLKRLGDKAGAMAAFRNAERLTIALPEAAIARFSDGEPASRIARAAQAELALLEETGGGFS